MIKGLLFFIKFAWQNEKKYLIYRILNQFVSSMIPLIAIVMPRYIINELMNGKRVTYLIIYAGIFVGYTFLSSTLSNWLTWSSFTHRIKLSQDFNNVLHEKTVKADYADIESSKYLELKEKAEKFLFGNWHGFSYVLDMAVEIIGKSFTLVGVIAIVATLNPLMVMLFIFLVLTSSYVESRVQHKQAKMREKLTLIERRTMYYSKVMEDFSYGKEIRINNMGSWLSKRENEHWNEGYNLYKNHNNYAIKSEMFNSFTNLVQQIVSYAYLVQQVLISAITIGDFSMYVGGVAAFSGAMRSLMQNIVEVSEYRHYYSAIEEYLNIPPKMRDNKQLPLPNGELTIEFRNVSFRYSGQNDYALKNINIMLNPKEKLSIVGENGAGKTTIIKLLCRIYDPTEGEILLNGLDIRDLDYDEYVSIFSTVFQDYKLYSLSIRDNVALSDKADDEKVERTLFKSGFGDKLITLPKGIDTLVYRNFDGEGFEPSGGEGQKIALARALYKDSPIVILDEPAATLDPKAEYRMYQRFNELVDGKTAVYISHRLSSTRFCDRVIVFDNGKIAETGTHHSLLEQNGLYAQMWKMQAEFYV